MSKINVNISAKTTEAIIKTTNNEYTNQNPEGDRVENVVIPHKYFWDKEVVDKIPADLRSQDKWLLIRLDWDYEKKKYGKMPKSSADRTPAKSNDATTWGSFERAINKIAPVNEALTYALNNDGVCVIDIDHCITNGQLSPAAQSVADLFTGTYIERSVSGDGIHIFCRGTTELRPNTKLIIDGEELDIEIYRDKRFIVVTGHLLNGADSVLLDMQTALDQVAAWAKKKEPINSSGISLRKSVLAEHSIDADTLRDALSHISPDAYGDWFRYGIAIKRWGEEIGDEDAAWELFNEWSQCTASGNYDQDANAQAWDDWLLDSENQVTVGSIIYDARKNGWKRDLRSVTSAANGSSGGRPEQIPHSTAAGSFYESVCEAESGMPMVRYLLGSWWVYNSTKGWQATSRDDIISRVVTFMQNDEGLSKLVSTHYVNSVVLNLGSANYCGGVNQLGQWITEDGLESGDNWIAFENDIAMNVMDAATALAEGRSPSASCAQKKSPAFFSKSYVGYDLVWPKPLDSLDAQIAERAPRFKAFIEQMLPTPEARRMAQQMSGIAMTDSSQWERMHFMTGNGANGKSVLIDILIDMLGSQNVCNMEPHLFGERFNSWVLTEHKMNIATDLSLYDGNSSISAVEATLKQVVTGEQVTVEKKFSPQYTCRYRARQIFATNHLPMFQDRSNGIKRRTIIIDFPVNLPEEKQDVNLAKKIIKSELSGVFLWALSGLADVLKNGVYESSAASKRKDKHFAVCQKEKLFLELNCMLDPESLVSKDMLYDRYKQWSKDGTYKPIGKHNFYEAVRQWGGKDIEEVSKTLDGKRCRIFRGIILHQLDADDVNVSEARKYNTVLQPANDSPETLRLQQTLGYAERQASLKKVNQQ